MSMNKKHKKKKNALQHAKKKGSL